MSEFESPPAAAPAAIKEESVKDKFIRRFKEEPLVPIGALLTCGALLMASTHLRTGNSKHMNYWLRARILFQGLTIAAVVGGTYAYGRSQSQIDAKREEETRYADYEKFKEKRAFEERLKAAEELTALEEAAGKSIREPLESGEKGERIRSALGWLPGGSSSSGVNTSPFSSTTAEPTPTPKAPTPSSGGFWSYLGWK